MTLGWPKLTPEKVQILMTCKPETVTFSGKFIECGEERINTLELTEPSAAEWAQMVEKMQVNPA